MGAPIQVTLSTEASKKRLRAPRHELREIDLERKRAFCSVCGYTEIFVAKARKRTSPMVRCIKRANELYVEKQKLYQRSQEEKRVKSGWKPRHRLSSMDTETMTAVCAVCGPTDVRQIRHKGHVRYGCANRAREYIRRYQRNHSVGRSTNPHALSQVNEEEKTAVCAKCGPVKIEIWRTAKKVNRRCINAKSEFAYVQRTQNLAVERDADETL